MERRRQDGANPTPASPPPLSTESPLPAAARLVADWVGGLGFLRLHAAVFAIAGAVLLLVDLILDPSDLWALDFLRIWLIVLGSHTAALAAGWATWRAIRPDRLTELPLAWFLPDTDEDDDLSQESDPDMARPLPATGRFTPGRISMTSADDDAPRGFGEIVSSVFAAIGDAVLDLADLARAGVAHTRRGIARGIDWVRNEDDDDDDLSNAAPIEPTGAADSTREDANHS